MDRIIPTEFASFDEVMKLGKEAIQENDAHFFGAIKFFAGDALKEVEEQGGYSEKAKKFMEDLVDGMAKKAKEANDKIMAEAMAKLNRGTPKENAEAAFLITRESLAKWLAASARKDYRGMEKAFNEHQEQIEKHGLKDIVMGEHLMMTPKEIKASTTATDSGLVPQLFVPVLIDRLYERSYVRQLCDVIPVTSTAGKIPGVTAGLTAYHHAEAVAPTESNITSTSLTYETEDISGLTVVSRKLLVDGMPIGLMNYLVRQVIDAVAMKEHAMFITGNDTNTWKAGLDAETLNEISCAGVGLDGILEAVGTLYGDNEAPPEWEASEHIVVKRKTPSILIVKSKGANGQYQPSALISLKQCLGYPWLFNSNLTEGTGYFVAMKAYKIFDVPQLTRIGTTEEGAYAVADSVAIFMHTSSDAMLATNGRAASAAAALKLVDIPTSWAG